MGVTTTTALVVGSLLVSGAAAYSQMDNARKARIAQEEQNNAQRNALRERELKEKAAYAAEEEKRRNALQAQSGGRKSTILTGGLGVMGEAPIARKTLMGQ